MDTFEREQIRKTVELALKLYNKSDTSCIYSIMEVFEDYELSFEDAQDIFMEEWNKDIQAQKDILRKYSKTGKNPNLAQEAYFALRDLEFTEEMLAILDSKKIQYKTLKDFIKIEDFKGIDLFSMKNI